MRAEMIRELDGIEPEEIHAAWRVRYSDFYRQKLDGERAAIYMADDDGAPIGIAAVYLLDNHRSQIFGRQSAYVSNVWVEPRHRKHGIASRLMRMAVDWAKQQGCEVVRLRTSSMGRPLYASLGFTSTDEMELRLT